MYRTEKKECDVKVCEYIENYVNVEEFLKYCEECPNYGNVWSCPPLMTFRRRSTGKNFR